MPYCTKRNANVMIYYDLELPCPHMSNRPQAHNKPRGTLITYRVPMNASSKINISMLVIELNI